MSKSFFAIVLVSSVLLSCKESYEEQYHEYSYRTVEVRLVNETVHKVDIDGSINGNALNKTVEANDSVAIVEKYVPTTGAYYPLGTGKMTVTYDDTLSVIFDKYPTDSLMDLRNVDRFKSREYVSSEYYIIRTSITESDYEYAQEHAVK